MVPIHAQKRKEAVCAAAEAQPNECRFMAVMHVNETKEPAHEPGNAQRYGWRRKLEGTIPMIRFPAVFVLLLALNAAVAFAASRDTQWKEVDDAIKMGLPKTAA